MKKNLWGVVKPLAEGESMQTRAQLAQFTSKDEQALGIILTALDDNFIHNLDDAQTAQAAWNTLEKLFGARAKHSKMTLKIQLYGLMCKNGEDLSSLINRLKSICTQLLYIDVKVDEEDKVAILLKALLKEYDNIVTILKEKDPIPDLEDVMNSLQEEEKKVKPTSTKHNNGAYIVTSKGRRCKHCKRTNHDSKDCFSILTCPHCKKTGHPASRCFFKNKQGGSSSSSHDKKKEQGKQHAASDFDNNNVNFVYDLDDIL